MFYKLLVLCILIFNSQMQLAFGAITDPKIDWKVIETEHFEVVYNGKYEKLAEKYALGAERAYDYLIPIYKEAPEKTLLIIQDKTDLANGFASFFPLPKIVVYPVLPNVLDSVSYYDDWIMEILIHEYAHVLTFYPSHGFYTPFKYIFGSVVRPNAILPVWYLEGSAVAMETRFTTQGRLRSPAYGANIRALVKDEKLAEQTLAKINESSVPEWPYGQRPYMFGAFIYHKIGEVAQKDLTNTLTQRYSRRFPFLLSGPLQDNIGLDINQLYEKTFTDLWNRAQEQLEKIAEKRQKKYKGLSNPAQGEHSPSISPNGRHLAYIAHQLYKGPEIRLLSRTKKSQRFIDQAPKTLVSGKGLTSVAWFPNSKKFVYDLFKTHNKYYQFRDLFVFDLKSKKSTRLTKGERATEATVSPDGKNIAYIKNGPNSTSIMSINVKSKNRVTIVPPAEGVRFSRPQYVSNDQIAVSRRNLKGEEELILINLESGDRVKLIKDFKDVRQLKWTRFGMLFVSDQSGVENLYYIDKKWKKIKALTNTSTRIINGDIDPRSKEIYVTMGTSAGSKIMATRNLKRTSPPKIEPIVDIAPSEVREFESNSIQMEKRDFSTWKYLIPRYWIPFVYTVENGVLIQGTSSSGDPLGKQSLLFDVSYDTSIQEPNYGISYLNGMSELDVGLYYSVFNDDLAGTEIITQDRSSGLTTSYPLTSWMRGGLGFLYLESELENIVLKRMGPTAFVTFAGSTTNTEDSNEVIGSSASFSFTQYLEQDDFVDYTKYTGVLTGVLKKWLPLRHSLLLQIKGSFSPDLNDSLAALVLLGDKNLGFNFSPGGLTSSYLTRGYPTASFAGQKLANATLEYRFPLFDVFKGSGITPVFFRSVDAILFADAIAVDGFFFNEELVIDGVAGNYEEVRIEDRQFYSAGLELKFNTTMAYHFPVSINLGLYYGFDQEAQGGFVPFVSFGITGIGDLGTIEQ